MNHIETTDDEYVLPDPQTWTLVHDVVTPDRLERTSGINIPEWGCLVKVETSVKLPDGTWAYACNTLELLEASVVKLLHKSTLVTIGTYILAWDATDTPD